VDRDVGEVADGHVDGIAPGLGTQARHHRFRAVDAPHRYAPTGERQRRAPGPDRELEHGSTRGQLGKCRNRRLRIGGRRVDVVVDVRDAIPVGRCRVVAHRAVEHGATTRCQLFQQMLEVLNYAAPMRETVGTTVGAAEIVELVWELVAQMHEHFHARVAELGLSPPQAMALRVHSALSAIAGRMRPASQPGTTATMLATRSVAGTTSSTGGSGVTGSLTTPSWPASSVHDHRPRATPIGMPTSSAMATIVVA